MIVGIVGSEAIKFTPESEQKARELIRAILRQGNVIQVCSGGCHLGGIDIWAIEEACELKISTIEFTPKQLAWSGYKERNLKIAKYSDEVHCITVDSLPEGYTGMRFRLCYHCGTDLHVKSGGCWTVKQAKKLGKRGFIHVIENGNARKINADVLSER